MLINLIPLKKELPLKCFFCVVLLVGTCHLAVTFGFYFLTKTTRFFSSFGARLPVTGTNVLLSSVRPRTPHPGSQTSLEKQCCSFVSASPLPVVSQPENVQSHNIKKEIDPVRCLSFPSFCRACTIPFLYCSL